MYKCEVNCAVFSGVNGEGKSGVHGKGWRGLNCDGWSGVYGEEWSMVNGEVLSWVNGKWKGTNDGKQSGVKGEGWRGVNGEELSGVNGDKGSVMNWINCNGELGWRTSWSVWYEWDGECVAREVKRVKSEVGWMIKWGEVVINISWWIQAWRAGLVLKCTIPMKRGKGRIPSFFCCRMIVLHTPFPHPARIGKHYLLHIEEKAKRKERGRTIIAMSLDG
jgi:hypothetical protein